VAGDRWSAGTAASRYRSLRQFFRWLEDDGELDVSPMAAGGTPRSSARRSTPAGRLSEVAGLQIDPVDFALDVLHVMGKGRRGRAVPFGKRKAARQRGGLGMSTGLVIKPILTGRWSPAGVGGPPS
jgi:site-specific recombinase XerC